jgi:hypothetical protein
MDKFIDKTDGGRGCIDCKVLTMGDTDGCANCHHKNDTVNNCVQINAENARKRDQPAEKRHFLYDWGYSPMQL